MRESWKKLGDLLPDAYGAESMAVSVDFDPTGKFGRYMDRRLKRLIKRQRRLWPAPQTVAPDRDVLKLPSPQDISPQE